MQLQIGAPAAVRRRATTRGAPRRPRNAAQFLVATGLRLRQYASARARRLVLAGSESFRSSASWVKAAVAPGARVQGLSDGAENPGTVLVSVAHDKLHDPGYVATRDAMGEPNPIELLVRQRANQRAEVVRGDREEAQGVVP